MKAIGVLVLLLTLATAALAAAPRQTIDQRQAAWQAFRHVAGSDWHVVWGKNGITPSVTLGTKPISLGAGRTPEQRALAAGRFFQDYGSLYGIRPVDDQLVVIGETQYGRMHYLKLEQRYKG